MLSSSSEWLAGRLVVELGGRIAVGVCGSLLSQAGATVVFVEPREAAKRGKFASRDLWAAGKRSLAIDVQDSADMALLNRLLEQADILVTSSDWDDVLGEAVPAYSSNATICDFTAFGDDSGERGLAEVDLQALSGVTHTTGFPGGPPCLLQVPILEYSSGVYGAAACAASLMTMRDGGGPQRIKVSLYKCALNALASFLPSVFQGGDPGRFGNGHPIAAPWNAYPCSDGWLMFCSASDLHWNRFCKLIGRPELFEDPRFRRNADRVANRHIVDEIVSEWTRQNTAAACFQALDEVGLAGGQIVPLSQLPDEPNIVHRKSIVTTRIADSDREIRLPRDVLKTNGTNPAFAPAVRQLDGDRGWLSQASFEPLVRGNGSTCDTDRLPLEGFMIVEIGQFTTAPLAARHLATYGAEVAKIEPPSGDAAREWAPTVDGTSIFFSMSNSGKSCLSVDLKTSQGLAKLEELLRKAHVLVENMKPGSLAALGLTTERLMEINPQLVYCPISGFGSDSAYQNRPAFDTVVQAMSGMMDANAAEGTPLKTSVSVCDFMGGEVALFAITAALYGRASNGKGAVLDLSMQDIAVWMTAGLWNKDAPRNVPHRVAACSDGYVLVGPHHNLPPELSAGKFSRQEAAAACKAAGVACVPVRSVAEAMKAPGAAGLVHMKKTANGSAFPILSPPLTISTMPLRAGQPPEPLRPL